MFVCLFLVFLTEAAFLFACLSVRQEFSPMLTKEGFFDLEIFFLYCRFNEVVGN